MKKTIILIIALIAFLDAKAQVQVNVNHEGVIYNAYIGIGPRVIKHQLAELGTDIYMTYTLDARIFGGNSLNYRAIIKKHITRDVSGYEGLREGNIGVDGVVDPSWITAGKLDLKLHKIDIVNKMFNTILQIEPLNADGTVKPEYQ
jgi:hypothetical protein